MALRWTHYYVLRQTVEVMKVDVHNQLDHVFVGQRCCCDAGSSSLLMHTFDAGKLYSCQRASEGDARGILLAVGC